MNIRLPSFRNPVSTSSGSNILAMMFCLGLSAMLAQILMTRELMVAFFGNELALGIIFSAWLLSVSLGSLVIRPFLAKLDEKHLCALCVLLLLVSAFILPALIFAARALRLLFSVPMGEYMSLWQMTAGTFLVFLPVCLIIGIIFPCACRLAAVRQGGVSGIYAAESAGSMVAGAAFSFILVYFLSPLQIALTGALLIFFGASLLARCAAIRNLCRVITLGLVALLLFPNSLNSLETCAVKLRWQSFGILPRGNIQYLTGNPRLLETRDSRYQNLALIEQEGQNTLYGNGQVLFVFPDVISSEEKIHFIMAQNPGAQNILLIGGNPVNDIPELLKYPLRALTHVELDAVINRILAERGGDKYRHALADPRLRQCLMDGPRFIKQAREQYDVVIIEAPEPTTVAFNRFYTVEFFRDIARILAPGGFLYTAVNSSEDLQDEAASIVVSIYKALQAVFPRVLVTYGPRNQFFAGKKDSPITFDGKTLYECWKKAGIETKYFRPEYFLNADEISADKTGFVNKRLAEVRTPINSDLRPISAFYNLLLWNRYSGSRLEWLFDFTRPVRIEKGLGAAGMIALLFICLTTILLGYRRPQAHGRIGRLITPMVVAATGFAGMALELILIFIFQSLLGYIYTSIGIIIAMYMLGLAVGGASVKQYAVHRQKECRRLFLELDCILLLISLCLPFLLVWQWNGSWMGSAAGIIYFLTLLTGFAGGAQFILGICLLNNLSPHEKQMPRHAALLNAVDLAGAALGGISIGVILLPLFGIGGACYLLAILKVGTLALISVMLLFQRI
jgi:spermidine synthase